MEEARQQKNRSETESNDVAFSGYKNKKWNRKFDKAGTRKESDAFPFRCHFCNEVGHMRRNCPKVKRKGGKQVNISEENGIIEKEEEEISFLTADDKNSAQTKPEIRKIKFVIDSGATHHLLRKVIYARNVMFNENKHNTERIIGIESEEKETNSQSVNERKENETLKEVDKEQDVEDEDGIRKSVRSKRKPAYLQEYDTKERDDEVNLMLALSAGNLPSEIPENFDEAITDQGWKQAIKEELDTLKEIGY